MSLQDLRDYITQHLEEVEAEYDDQTSSQYQSDYLEGVMDAYQHVLGKLD